MVPKAKNIVAVAVGQPELTPGKSVDLLRKHSSLGLEILSSRPISADKYSVWVLLAGNYLAKAFGSDSPNIASVVNIGRFGGFAIGTGEAWSDNHRAESLKTQIAKLNVLIELLETECELQKNDIVESGSNIKGRQIFLIHGHDHPALRETTSFLEKLQQEVVVLPEKPDQGKTIVDKFEECADVGFAVVLLAANEKGGVKSPAREGLHLRAHKNVIFGLGYFIGKLGKNRVCALFESGVDIPSDCADVLYIEMDKKGAWHLQLAKELKAAGLPVDMNDAF